MFLNCHHNAHLTWPSNEGKEGQGRHRGDTGKHLGPGLGSAQCRLLWPFEQWTLSLRPVTLPLAPWPEEPTYREVAESIYWWWPFLQLRCSVGHDVVQERLHGWLMEWLLLWRRSLLFHQQVWIKLTRLLHHLLLHAKRSTLQTTNHWRKLWEKEPSHRRNIVYLHSFSS